MMALRAQMNPHFIFNSLNSIREMILHTKNKSVTFSQQVCPTDQDDTQPFGAVIHFFTQYHGIPAPLC
ncbi:MAG: histidine kinase [Chitinophagaceae bacterium]|nr:histidine kinase [Chitinophagaceae bacterium]